MTDSLPSGLTRGMAPGHRAGGNLRSSADSGLCTPCSKSFTTQVRSELGSPPGGPWRSGLLRLGLSSVICPLIFWTAASTWWSQRGGPTRPHSELGRETPLRPGYCPLKGGRAGHRQVEPAAQAAPAGAADDRWPALGLDPRVRCQDQVGANRARSPRRHPRLTTRFAPGQTAPHALCAVLSVPRVKPEGRLSDLRRLTFCHLIFAGWSSPVARQAHNLKVAGSNPAPATKFSPVTQKVTGLSHVRTLAPHHRHGIAVESRGSANPRNRVAVAETS
jgi:hypothetical protein